MRIDIGKVAITAGGYWKNNKSYEALTLVVYKASEGGDGCGYIALKNNIGVTPGTDEKVWMIATQAGQSIYDLSVARGYSGTEDEFVAEYNAAVAAANAAAESAARTEAGINQGEAGRVRAEAERAADEDARSTAERQRASDEDARKQAEALRVQAEEGRSTTFARQSAQMAAALEAADESTTAANTAAGNANAAATYARETAEEAAGHAEEAAETTKQMNAGLIGLKVEDGELILVQNAETGTVTGGEIDENGMVTIEFEV